MRTRTTISLVLMAALTVAPAFGQEIMTGDNAAPIGDNQNSQTAGPTGPVLLQDVHLIQKLQRFDRERIPERVVHARGTGAHGEFVATEDISDLTMARLFEPGTVTPVFVRFSTVIHGLHSPETLRDPRGFATKFYTSEGNWDLVGNNLPIFFIRDAIKFPDMIHALKPSPRTNIQDPNRIFDFFSHVPEATHMFTQLYSDLGIPASYRTMEGNSVHAYKFVNAQGEYRYVKLRWESQQGIENLTADEAAAVQARDFNHLSRDLVEAIDSGNHPSWDLLIQVLEPEQLAGFDFDPLDATKIWPDVPERKIGTMTLNRNPDNVFQETEQSALAPANLVPGIQPSEDRMLQGRLFSYADTQLYRVGANAQQLPINRPRAEVVNGHQDGFMNFGNTTSEVNYQPSRLEPTHEAAHARLAPLPLAGTTQQQAIHRKQPFRQAGEFYRGLPEQDRANLISNLAGDLGEVRDLETRHIMLSYFYKADADYGTRLTQATSSDLARVQRKAAELTDE